MATTISNSVSRDPLMGGNRGVASPFSFATKKKTISPLQLGTYKSTNVPTPGLVQPIKTSTPTQQAGASSASISTPPMQTSQAPINGLLKPDYSSLNTGLKNVQGGLVELQNQQKATSFPGLVGGIASASNPSGVQTGLVQDIKNAAGGFAPIGEEARRISKQYADEIARIGGLGAGAVAGALSTGTDVVGSGNAAIASQSASQRMSALSAAQQAALQGTEQQLSAQGQAAGTLGSALSGASTLQQQQLGGLGTAAGLAAPSGNYPFVFNPVTGEFSQAGGGSGIISPQQAAMDVISGKTGYEQARAALGYLGGTGEAQLQSAITAAGGNPLQLQAQGASQASNIQQQQTAQTDIARSGLQQATDTYMQQLLPSYGFAQNQSTRVVDILNQKGLNSSSSTDYNTALNSLSRRFSDTDLRQLETALQEAQFAYTLLLSTGGSTPSANDSRAMNTLNINNSASAIKASIAELEKAAYERLSQQQQVMQSYQQNLSGSGSQTTPQQSQQSSNVEFYQKPDGSWAYR